MAAICGWLMPMRRASSRWDSPALAQRGQPGSQAQLVLDHSYPLGRARCGQDLLFPPVHVHRVDLPFLRLFRLGAVVACLASFDWCSSNRLSAVGMLSSYQAWRGTGRSGAVRPEDTCAGAVTDWRSRGRGWIVTRRRPRSPRCRGRG